MLLAVLVLTAAAGCGDRSDRTATDRASVRAATGTAVGTAGLVVSERTVAGGLSYVEGALTVVRLIDARGATVWEAIDTPGGDRIGRETYPVAEREVAAGRYRLEIEHAPCQGVCPPPGELPAAWSVDTCGQDVELTAGADVKVVVHWKVGVGCRIARSGRSARSVATGESVPPMRGVGERRRGG